MIRYAQFQDDLLLSFYNYSSGKVSVKEMEGCIYYYLLGSFSDSSQTNIFLTYINYVGLKTKLS